MKKTLYFGKIDWNGTGRKINLVTVEINLKETEKGPVFSASANVWNSKQTDYICSGQCLDYLVPFFQENEVYMTIFSMWKKYHRNDMHPGTPAQEESLKKVELLNVNKYDEACKYLKSINLYDDNGKVYGRNWYYWPIPDEDLEIIKSLLLYGE